MIGIDIVSIPRFERFVARYGDRGLSKFLSSSEMGLIKSPKNAAGFWAIKEAISKALKCGISREFTFFDAEIYKSEKGAPCVSLGKSVKERFGVSGCEVSLTHDGGFVVAVALLVKV